MATLQIKKEKTEIYWPIEFAFTPEEVKILIDLLSSGYTKHPDGMEIAKRWLEQLRLAKR